MRVPCLSRLTLTWIWQAFWYEMVSWQLTLVSSPFIFSTKVRSLPSWCWLFCDLMKVTLFSTLSSFWSPRCSYLWVWVFVSGLLQTLMINVNSQLFFGREFCFLMRIVTFLNTLHSQPTWLAFFKNHARWTVAVVNLGLVQELQLEEVAAVFAKEG